MEWSTCTDRCSTRCRHAGDRPTRPTEWASGPTFVFADDLLAPTAEHGPQLFDCNCIGVALNDDLECAIVERKHVAWWSAILRADDRGSDLHQLSCGVRTVLHCANELLKLAACIAEHRKNRTRLGSEQALQVRRRVVDRSYHVGEGASKL